VLVRVKHPEVLRYFLLSSQYRGPINYSFDQLDQAESALGRLYTALRDLALPTGAAPRSGASDAFEAAMDDDFNTPEAFAVLQGLARSINAARDSGDTTAAVRFGAELRALGNVLGLVTLEPSQWFRASSGAAAAGPSDADIDAQIAARLAARKAKQWAESDRIRDELARQGVILEDKPGGVTVWRRA
jgi:cysteinyl-tRNA synthetase